MKREHNPAGMSALELTMHCGDGDTVRCLDEDGRSVCAGPWYSDRVMAFLNDPPRARYVMEREGNTVTARRIKKEATA